MGFYSTLHTPGMGKQCLGDSFFVVRSPSGLRHLQTCKASTRAYLSTRLQVHQSAGGSLQLEERTLAFPHAVAHSLPHHNDTCFLQDHAPGSFKTLSRSLGIVQMHWKLVRLPWDTRFCSVRQSCAQCCFGSLPMGYLA